MVQDKQNFQHCTQSAENALMSTILNSEQTAP